MKKVILRVLKVNLIAITLFGSISNAQGNRSVQHDMFPTTGIFLGTQNLTTPLQSSASSINSYENQYNRALDYGKMCLDHTISSLPAAVSAINNTVSNAGSKILGSIQGITYDSYNAILAESPHLWEYFKYGMKCTGHAAYRAGQIAGQIIITPILDCSSTISHDFANRLRSCEIDSPFGESYIGKALNTGAKIAQVVTPPVLDCYGNISTGIADLIRDSSRNTLYSSANYNNISNNSVSNNISPNRSVSGNTNNSTSLSIQNQNSTHVTSQANSNLSGNSSQSSNNSNLTDESYSQNISASNTQTQRSMESTAQSNSIWNTVTSYLPSINIPALSLPTAPWSAAWF